MPKQQQSKKGDKAEEKFFLHIEKLYRTPDGAKLINTILSSSGVTRPLEVPENPTAYDFGFFNGKRAFGLMVLDALLKRGAKISLPPIKKEK